MLLNTKHLFLISPELGNFSYQNGGGVTPKYAAITAATATMMAMVSNVAVLASAILFFIRSFLYGGHGDGVPRAPRHAWPRSHEEGRGSRGHAQAMPLTTKHRFLISPQLGNQFILIWILTPIPCPPCRAHSVAFQVELLET
jgi:hypothetical protein